MYTLCIVYCTYNTYMTIYIVHARTYTAWPYVVHIQSFYGDMHMNVQLYISTVATWYMHSLYMYVWS